MPTAGPPFRVPREDKTHTLLVRAPGYEDRTVEIEASRNRVVEVVMVASIPAPKAAPPQAEKRTVGEDKPSGSAKSRERRRTHDKDRGREAITDL